jgi:ketosteroid isomerase-like protein
MGVEDRKNIARRYLDLLPLGRIKELPLAEQFSGWSSLSGDVPGAEFLERILILPKIFSPPLQFTIESITAEDERVAVQCHSQGMLVNGIVYDNQYHYLMTFTGDRLLKVFEYMNAKKAEKLFAALQATRAPAATLASAEDKRTAAIQFVNRLSTGDLSGLPLADDFSVWTPVNGNIGRVQYETAAKTVAGLAPEGLKFTIDGSTVEGDRVAVEASCRATLRTGGLYDQHYHFVFQFQNGRIHRLRTHLDTKMVADVVLPALSKDETIGLSLKQN